MRVLNSFNIPLLISLTFLLNYPHPYFYENTDQIWAKHKGSAELDSARFYWTVTSF